MVTGRVIRFDEVKGYGFITPSEGGEDVFVHANEITDRGLRVGAGTQVAFRVLEGDRGLKAYDVRIIDDQEQPGLAADSAGPSAEPRAEPRAERRPAADDELHEVFAEPEFVHQITELLLTAAPQLTGSGIVELRGRLLEFARQNGWVESL
jgi:cold shock CspA family protein